MPHCIACWRRPLVTLFVLLVISSGLAVGDDQKAADDGNDPAAPAEKSDRYAVPDGDSQAILKFVAGLQKFRPNTAEEFFEHRKKAPLAMKAAAEKILELEEDPESPAAQTARLLLLNAKVASIGSVEADQQKAIVQEIAKTLKSAKRVTGNELGLAFGAASALEQTGNKALAMTAYRSFGEFFANQDVPQLASYGKKMVGSARRLGLVGKEMQIEGKLVDGGEFDWESYRGKVVLVDFWATWCGPCVRELPNVKKQYELYHDKGFDVVGISIDSDRARLEAFLKERALPWKTMFEDGVAGDHPVATRYGVMAIPTVILVDKEGKVISLNARGPELGRLLEEQLGPADAG